MLFYGSYAAAMRDPTPEDIELDETFGQMIKVGWARTDSAFRRVFTSMMIPEATEEQMRWLDELQRVAVSAEIAYASRQERKKADVTHLLPAIDVPTLVLHSRDDQMNGFELSRSLAANISGARLVALDGCNHIMLEDEPSWPVLLAEITAFLEPDRQQHPRGLPRPDLSTVLSERELEVLTPAAQGHDDAVIAKSLSLSVRTLERHLQNVYAKLAVTGRSARTAAVARLLAPA